jgi:hypothetical protein
MAQIRIPCLGLKTITGVTVEVATPAVPPTLPNGSYCIGSVPPGTVLHRIVLGEDGMLDLEASARPED